MISNPTRALHLPLVYYLTILFIIAIWDREDHVIMPACWSDEDNEAHGADMIRSPYG
jgi:hypothetical protein